MWQGTRVLFPQIPVELAVTLAVCTSSIVGAAVLLQLALRLPHGPCRGAGFLGMGTLCTGVGMVVDSLSRAEHDNTWTLQANIAWGVFATGFFALGLLFLPGAAPTLAARARRALDGFSIGTSVFLTIWLMVIVPLAGGAYGRIPNSQAVLRTIGIALIASVALTIAVLTVARAAHYRRATLVCGFGVALSITGCSLWIILGDLSAAPWTLAIPGMFLIIGPNLIWLGARSTGEPPKSTHPVLDSGTLAGLPLLTVPVALALAATAYHLVALGSFDRYSSLIGVVAVAGLAARELFTTIDLRKYAARLAEREAHFRSIVAGSNDVAMVMDRGTVVRWQSPAAARQLGLSDHDVVGRPFTSLIHPDDVAKVTDYLREIAIGSPRIDLLLSARLRDGFGRWRDTESSISDQRHAPEVNGFVIHVRDIGERRELEHTLHKLAFADPLTGLPNRRHLLRTMAERATEVDATIRPHSVLLINMDDFRSVNDLHGCDLADIALIEIARRLRNNSERESTIVRLGADEFAVLIAEPIATAHFTATRLLTVLSEPYQLPDKSHALITASIGLAPFAGDSGHTMRGADIALRLAKQRGKNTVESYTPALEDRMLHRLTVENELHGALDRGEIDLSFRPIVALDPRSVVGFEVIPLWRHPQLGTIPPAEFMPVAESSGMVNELGRWLLQQVCRRLAAWGSDNPGHWLSMSISPRQLYSPSFASEVSAVLNTYGAPPQRLVLGIAEHDVATDARRLIGQLARLRSLGLRIALENFGAGFSSLASMRRLPIDILKTDPTLLDARPRIGGVAAGPIADVIIQLGQRLGMEVIVDGVEMTKHLEIVSEVGCQLVQGPLFGDAMPLERAEAVLCDENWAYDR